MLKKLSNSLLLVILVLAVASCGHINAQKDKDALVSFVNQTMSEFPKYSPEDWDAAKAQFNQLVDQVDKSYEKLTPEERQQASDAAHTFDQTCQLYTGTTSTGAESMFEQLQDGGDISDLFE